jgi:hypothetical protein
MNYYKIIKDNNFIGVVNSNNFLTYNSRYNTYIRTNETAGEFVEYKGILYRSTWMKPLTVNTEYQSALILEISEEEYNIYLQAEYDSEGNNQEPVIIIPDNPEEKPSNPVEETSLEYLCNLKIKAMKRACQQAIYAGFDVEWEDHTTSHFSMTEQDQLNLMELSTMIASGMPSLPYHADGETAKFYTVEEAQKIINASTKHKMYHTSYFNCLKQYIQSLETIEEVAAITYGDTIPAEFETDVYKMVK